MQTFITIMAASLVPAEDGKSRRFQVRTTIRPKACCRQGSLTRADSRWLPRFLTRRAAMFGALNHTRDNWHRSCSSGARTQPSETEYAKMALSMSGHPVLEPIQAIYGRPDVWRHPTPTVRKAAAPDASVRSQATSIRRKEFQAEDRRRRVALLKRMIADFERTVADLDREILIEQQRANIHDPAHFAYPTYAKAAILRRDNL